MKTSQLKQKTKCKILMILSCCIFFFIPISMSGVNQITVEKMTHNELETTAMTAGNHLDQNGKRPALIIVHNVDIGGFKFNINAWNKVEEGTNNEGEKVYFIFIQEGTKSLTISNSDKSIEPSKPYYFKHNIKSGKTYHLYLGKVFTSDVNARQYVEFQIIPAYANATLVVNEDPVEVKNGIAQVSLPFGTHNYRISAGVAYEADAGSLLVDSKERKIIKKITLKPNFGWLDMEENANLAGAKIYIDNAPTTLSQLKTDSLMIGTHRINIYKEFYEKYDTVFEIKSNQRTKLFPILKTNYAITKIVVTGDANASIWIDDKKLSDKGEWEGRLEPGSYIVEARKDGHDASRDQLTIRSNDKEKIHRLDPPTPNYGTIDIKSTPNNATVTIDGVYKGVTAYTSQLLEGYHTVTISKQGYRPETRQVRISKNHIEQLQFNLDNVSTVTISGIGSYDDLYIDDKPYNKTTFEGKVGEKHKIYIKPSWDERYKPFKKTVTITTKPQTVYVKYPKIYTRKNEFYFEAGGALALGMGASGAMGFHAGKFNMEAFYIYGMGKETVYEVRTYQNWGSDYDCTSIGSAPVEVTTPHIFGGKIGIGIDIGQRFKFTPQIGYRYVMISGSGEYVSDGHWSSGFDSYCMNAMIGFRAFLALSRNFGLSVSPSYCFVVNEGDACKTISEQISSIESIRNGLDMRFSFVLNF